MSPFRPGNGRSPQWASVYEFVKTLDADAVFSLDDVIAVVADEHDTDIDDDRARQIISEMNRHIYTDGVRVMSLRHGRKYVIGTPTEKLTHATDTVSARIRNAIQDAKRANIAVLKDSDSTDDERQQANDSLNHYDALATHARRNRREQLRLRPELPRFGRRSAETGELMD